MVNSAASHKKAAKPHDLKDLIQLGDCFVEREGNKSQSWDPAALWVPLDAH